MKKHPQISQEEAIFCDIGDMTLMEKRFLYCALLHIEEHNLVLTADQHITFDASLYAQHFDESLENAYKSLKKGLLALFEREFKFIRFTESGSKCSTTSRWVGSVHYTDAHLTVGAYFAPCTHQFLIELMRKKQAIGLTLDSFKEKTERLLEA